MNFFNSLSFTQKYIFALSTIAAFTILAYFNLTYLINEQAHDGEIINTSGRQRMLSQKTALFAVNYKTKQLQETVDLMDKSHANLLSRKMSDRLKKIYFSEPIMLDKKVKTYISNARSFIKSRDGRSLTYLLNNSQKLLKDLDSAVTAYQKDTEFKTKKLQKNELYILLLTLITLLLEALFIFRPANRSVNIKTKELKSQKEYADMITQTNTNAIIAVDHNFDILTFNKSAEEMFGYSAEEMLHTKLTDDKIIPLRFLKQHNSGLMNFMKSGQLKNVNEVFELEGQKKDKTLFPIRISFGSKIEENSKIVVANIQNITKEKEKDSLILQQSRFAAMGEMIGNIAHQWRQPLSSISALATGTRLRYKNNLISDEELEETFVKIKNYTQHLSKTIDDFRDFLNKDQSTEKFNIVEAVDKSISLTEASYKDNKIKLVVHYHNKEMFINGSSSQLSQVFLNILNNAKDILLEKDIDPKVVLIEVLKDGHYAIVNINDNAGGIPDDVAVKVYEPYFTTKHKSQGTGIGLFMSKRIVEQRFNGILENTNRNFEVDEEKYYGASFSLKIKLEA
ncbi:MAG: PAS domain S-box protein [Candidatus Hydrogenedentes bacterium]|nr:PAS domain S-box protein [Candidatus Hydrogenedentota bacterium]